MEGLKAFVCSFRYAISGIGYAFRNGRNFRLMTAAAAYVIWTAWFLKLNGTEWALELLCCALVLGLEALNTALERLCDRVTEKPDPYIKAAKDCAAGAALLASVGAAAVWLAITVGNGYWRALSDPRWWGVLVITLPFVLYRVFRREKETS